MQGGAIQALGGALLEEFEYDDAGNPLASSFVDYLIPSISEAPAIDVILSEEHPALTNPLGVKGCGEAGVPGVAAAIAAAIEHAVGLRGRICQTPITPALVRGLR